MRSLSRYDNRIVDIPLFDLPNLTSLDLSFNKIHHITNLDNLTGLTNLYLSSNKIKQIENLSHLVPMPDKGQSDES
jgi:protein phosphatase 1 regulatory subunit 7